MHQKWQRQTNSNSKSKQPITSFFTSFLTSSITTSLASTHNYYSQPLVTLIDKKGIRPPSTVQQSCHQFQQEGRYVIFGLPPAILNFHQRVRGKTELFFVFVYLKKKMFLFYFFVHDSKRYVEKKGTKPEKQTTQNTKKKATQHIHFSTNGERERE